VNSLRLRLILNQFVKIPINDFNKGLIQEIDRVYLLKNRKLLILLKTLI